MTIGEVIVSVLVVLGFLLADMLDFLAFDYRVITGAILGGAVTVANYALLTLSVNREVNKYLELRGTGEMSDEEAEKFASENSMPIQNAIKLSFIIRTVSMLATLVAAFLLDMFNPIATAIPLLAFRPLLSAIEIVKGKMAK